MLIEQGDLKAVLNRARDAYSWGLFTVMSPLGYTRPKDLHFCGDNTDMALFYHDHPLDTDKFKGYDVRTVYEAAAMLHRGGRDVVEFSQLTDGAGHKLFDLDKLMDFRLQERALADTLGKLNWKQHWGQQPDEGTSYLPEDKLWEVLDGMEQLCQSEMGRGRMARLWETVVPAQYTRPYFLEPSDKLGDIVLGTTRLPTSNNKKQPKVSRYRPPKRGPGPRL